MFIQCVCGEEATTDGQRDKNVLPNNVPKQQEVMENDQTEEPEENAPVNEIVAEEHTQ